MGVGVGGMGVIVGGIGVGVIVGVVEGSTSAAVMEVGVELSPGLPSISGSCWLQAGVLRSRTQNAKRNFRIRFIFIIEALPKFRINILSISGLSPMRE